MPPATHKEEAEIQTLIEQNLRLVLRIANDFLGRGLPWDDLVSEGNRGLVIAAERYEPERGTRFSTYSAWWIKQAIRQAIAEQAQTVRVPIGAQLNFSRIMRERSAMLNELKREPTDEELAGRCHLPLVTVQRLRHSQKPQIQSLNTAISESDDNGGEFIDFLPDDETPAPDTGMIEVEDIEQLLELLDTLPERERDVLRYRFGLDGEVVKTLDEVGALLGCTNERIRQIQNQALKKLQVMMEA